MPTQKEIDAGAEALHARREKSRTALAKWPDINEEVRIVLEAAEKARALPVARLDEGSGSVTTRTNQERS